MRTRMLTGIIGLALLLNPGDFQSVHASGMEPLDGRHVILNCERSSEKPPERTALLPPNSATAAIGASQGRVPPNGTPSGAPSPPNQLTPAPVLPFNPNRPIMPAPTAPSPSAGSGRLAR
jgi:hypothetical protein